MLFISKQIEQKTAPAPGFSSLPKRKADSLLFVCLLLLLLVLFCLLMSNSTHWKCVYEVPSNIWIYECTYSNQIEGIVLFIAVKPYYLFVGH